MRQDPKTDSRNLIDDFKGKAETEIIAKLDQNGVALEVAIENTLRDFNMGTIVRNANAFGVRTVHIIGRKQWNKRGAMATDKYLHIVYYSTIDEFLSNMQKTNKHIFAIENNCLSDSIFTEALPESLVMVFGQESTGVSAEMLERVEKVLHIPQLGSTRSVNVGVASGIAMYEWNRQQAIDHQINQTN